MRSCLITGAAGFIGSYLASCLAGDGVPVTGTVHRNARPVLPLPEGVTLLPCDLTDPQQVMETVAWVAPDCVFHLAAQSNIPRSWKEPRETLQANVLGTLHLLEALREVTPGAVIVIAGSSAEYGSVRPDELPVSEDQPLRPSSPYGASKVAQEMLGYAYFRSYGLRVTSVRPFYITGPGKGDACNEFARQIVQVEQGKLDRLRVGNLEAVRDVVDVRDAARALALVAEVGTPGEAYNLCSGRGYSIQELLDGLVSLASVPVAVEPDPARLRPADDPVLVGDSSRLRALGWQPRIPLEQTLSDTLRYWKRRLELSLHEA